MVAPSPLLRLILCALYLCWPTAANAQTVKRPEAAVEPPPTPSPSVHSEPLAAYVPIEAGVYLRISDDRWRDVLAPEAKPGTHKIQALLKGRARVIAMPSWRDRKETITLCRPEDSARFARAIGASDGTLIGEEGVVRVYRLPPARFVATDGVTFVFSDIGLAGSALFQKSVSLLNRRPLRSLHHDPRFRESLGQVDPQASAVAFVDEPWKRRQGAEDPNDRYRPSWLPDLQSGSLEMFLEDDQIRAQLRSRRRTPAEPLTEAIAPEQAALVPPSAAAAWMMPVGSLSLIEFAARHLPRSQSPFARQLSRVVAETELKGILPLTEIGPRTTWCVLSNLSGSGVHGVLMIEARRPKIAAETLGQICRGVADLVNTHETAINYEAEYVLETYKGHTVHQLAIHPLGNDAVVWPVIMDMQPSISTIGGQLLLAGNPAAIHALIDHAVAGADGSPRVRQWMDRARQPQDDTRIRGFINPAQLAGALRPIQQSLQSSDTELLDSEWFQDLRDFFQDTPVQLGARLQRENSATPGRVLVISVLEGHPADGKLLRGDYITGIDGHSLALDNPTEDLRQKLQDRAAGGKRLLRIERDGRLLDVAVVLRRASDKSIVGLLNDTRTAIDRLEALGRHIEVIEYRQHGNDPQQLEADMILRLRSSDTP